ncbi:MAG: Fe2+-dependent dioxygenase [Pseudomonadota bacterium]
MLLTISDVLSSDQRPELDNLIKKLDFKDGRKTAGKVAKKVKRNEQADLTSVPGVLFVEKALEAISQNSVLLAAARPRRFSHLLVSRTSDGGFYGPHIDNAIMAKGKQRFRSDLSFTLFLSDPDQYIGGDLVIHSAGAAQAIRGEFGDLVLYPTSSVHEVSPVTSGQRVVCVGWIESLIQDDAQRALLFDLENLRVSLKACQSVGDAEKLVLDKSIANLLRMWARP